MERMHWLNVGLTVVLVSAVIFQIRVPKENKLTNDVYDYITSPLTSPNDETEASRKLVEYSKGEFLTPRVVRVTDNVHVAIGFAIANSILVEGKDGLIIIDTTESLESMSEILVEFRKISEKPVKAIIFTHFHGDHLLGTNAIIEEGKKMFPEQKIDIYCHEMTMKMMTEFSNIAFMRAIRQFGMALPKTNTGAGLGLMLRITANSDIQPPVPNKFYSDHAAFNVAGLEFELLHTPGETDDQTAIWFPELKVVMPGDNIYKAFPNLYAIRGSRSRDTVKWYQSLDVVRALGADYMVPSHTRPIVGSEAVYDTLLVYRDAIKFIHDQTVMYLDKGYLPGDIVEKVKLPDSIASHPYLQEHYGTVEWSVRGIFDHYLGWFNGDAGDLEPLASKERAFWLADLVSRSNGNASGLEIILQEAQEFLYRSHEEYTNTGRHLPNEDKWALELANTALKISEPDSKYTTIAKNIKVSALTSLGIESVSANGRNYYLTAAMETEKDIKMQRPKEAQMRLVNRAPVAMLLKKLCLRVKGLECQKLNYTVKLDFTDLDQTFSVTLRNSVCDVTLGNPAVKGPSEITHLSMTSQTFKSLMTAGAGLEIRNAIQIKKGSGLQLRSFMKCFELHA